MRPTVVSFDFKAPIFVVHRRGRACVNIAYPHRDVETIGLIRFENLINMHPALTQ